MFAAALKPIHSKGTILCIYWVSLTERLGSINFLASNDTQAISEKLKIPPLNIPSIHGSGTSGTQTGIKLLMRYIDNQYKFFNHPRTRREPGMVYTMSSKGQSWYTLQCWAYSIDSPLIYQNCFKCSNLNYAFNLYPIRQSLALH